jgi:hypothetical protein
MRNLIIGFFIGALVTSVIVHYSVQKKYEHTSPMPTRATLSINSVRYDPSEIRTNVIAIVGDINGKNAVLLDTKGNVIWEGDCNSNNSDYDWRTVVGKKSGILCVRSSNSYSDSVFWTTVWLKNGIADGMLACIGDNSVDVRTIRNMKAEGPFGIYFFSTNGIPFAARLSTFQNDLSYVYYAIDLKSGKIRKVVEKREASTEAAAGNSLADIEASSGDQGHPESAN